MWGGRTEPFYRQNLNPLIFRMNGTNVLNPSGKTWDYQIEHWSIGMRLLIHRLPYTLAKSLNECLRVYCSRS